MSNFFDVRPKNLELEPNEAVELFGELLRAEAWSIGLSPDKVHVPLSITAPDGGIDATVHNIKGKQRQGLIRSGINCYQIKTGNLSPNRLSDVQKILFHKRSGKLHPKIEQCLKQNGFLAIVFFNSSLPTREIDATSLFKNELHNKFPEYDNPKIEVWQQDQIIGFLQKFSPLQKKLTHTTDYRCRIPLGKSSRSLCCDSRYGLMLNRSRTYYIRYTHAEWYNQSEEIQTNFVGGDKQQGFINQIREKLEPSSDETSIRIIGSPGSGKTRIAYEIANKPELSPLVLYFENPNDVYDKNFLSRLLESNSYAILIVDECDEYEDRKLRDRVTPHSSRIKLITIDNEQKNGRVYELPQLDEHTITKIISGYNIPEETSIRYAPWCTPSPRLANWVGKNLRTDPNFSIFSEDEIYNRFIAGRLQPDSPEFNNRKHVLMWISLFVKVGFNDPYSGELQGLAKKVKQKSGVPEESFFDIVHQLHRMKLLQGHSTLYITPRSLQFWLWREWWQSYGAGFDLEKFMCVDESTEPPTYFPKSMQERFFAMFRHAPESSNVMRVVRSFLSINGLLEKNELLETGMGARLFSALAETEPRLALNLLNRTVGKWDRQKLLNFGEGRRELLWSLEDLVHEVKNFHDAAKILLRLAAAENEDAANNATGIFAELFSMPPKELARTEASIDIRLNFLRKVLASSDKEERMCALKACDKALESLHFERIDYRHSRILTLTAENWKPGHREISAYQKVIENICSMLDKMDPDEQQEAIHIILNRARALTRLKLLAKPLTDKINELYQKPYANKEEIISAVESVVYYDQEKLDSTIIDLWKKLKNNFQRNDYHSLMKRYVEMNILTDDFDENNRRAGIIETQIKKLAHIPLGISS